MTQESMIKVLRYKSEHIKTRIKPEFFSEVADALQQQSCENLEREYQKTKALFHKMVDENDTISRQAVKEGLLKYGFHAEDMTVTEFVEDLPPVQPKPKTGHWVSYLKEGLIVKCSGCGSRFSLGYNFCPNCGARMAESQVESEE